MITQADAIVIGAGAFGLSTGLHLANQGLSNVAVLDKFEPASQTSPRAAGLFKLIQPDPVRTELVRLSIRIVLHFEEEMGVPLPVTRSGSIILARTPTHARLIREEAKRSEAWGVDVEMINPREAHRRMPFLEPQNIQAACYTPQDVYIEEPLSLLQAYRRAGERRGMQVIGNTPVTGIRLRGGEVAGVMTPQGEIDTSIVVDTAGAWAGLVADMAETFVPVAPVRHQLYITEHVEGLRPEHPILRITDAAVYIRPCRGGLMLGAFEPDPRPFMTEIRSSDFSIDDVPLDVGVLNAMARAVEDQVPTLKGARLQDHRGGLATMTPDGRFLVGPVPGARGLWTATGCNVSGFSASPAVGQVLAEWITSGEPSIDLGPLQPDRFAGIALGPAQVIARGVWQYAHFYDPEASRAA
jgi:glycine/D-amino acid oxidase-like deaminating enzyme